MAAAMTNTTTSGEDEFIQRKSTGSAQQQPENLFPKQSDCAYVSCYCEENVYKLCEAVQQQQQKQQQCNNSNLDDELDSLLSKCYAVFVSNPKRTVPFWRQRAGKDDDKLVIWDYHVMFVYQPSAERSALVYDLDSVLPFPTYVHKYVTETFRTDNILKPDYFRYFRVVAARDFLRDFASDRRHMRRADGTWIKTPPPWPSIGNDSANSTTPPKHNLDDYIQMDAAKGPGQVYTLTQFVQRFYCKQQPPAPSS